MPVPFSEIAAGDVIESLFAIDVTDCLEFRVIATPLLSLELMLVFCPMLMPWAPVIKMAPLELIVESFIAMGPALELMMIPFVADIALSFKTRIPVASLSVRVPPTFELPRLVGKLSLTVALPAVLNCRAAELIFKLMPPEPLVAERSPLVRVVPLSWEMKPVPAVLSAMLPLLPALMVLREILPPGAPDVKLPPLRMPLVSVIVPPDIVGVADEMETLPEFNAEVLIVPRLIPSPITTTDPPVPLVALAEELIAPRVIDPVATASTFPAASSVDDALVFMETLARLIFLPELDIGFVLPSWNVAVDGVDDGLAF